MIVHLLSVTCTIVYKYSLWAEQHQRKNDIFMDTGTLTHRWGGHNRDLPPPPPPPSPPPSLFPLPITLSLLLLSTPLLPSSPPLSSQEFSNPPQFPLSSFHKNSLLHSYIFPSLSLPISPCFFYSNTHSHVSYALQDDILKGQCHDKSCSAEALV